ncbi:hypothetical protein SLEP1_g22506 [Rubroshorea leprosula]|uniref:Disease resistance protein At4g27190-like leucine-rich repeats domain-containing protein n=1 Tax=Rubroshorea leprosula TaxID=152421 RepID=A0AAV5JFI4_9ROSI|nr:hypothetical protein SLEP1_g22506 [Rubroshorea leprosula]
MRQCINMRSLSDVALVLQNATELSYCSIWNCEEIECVIDLVSLSSLCSHVLKLQMLVLGRLPKLCELVSVEGTPMPLRIFSSLKYFHITRCSGIRKLFPVELLQGFQIWR